ncbi:MAG: hypothetical protein D3910_19365 [Candidatus Electrothrix sp. ATG2]|nr:hypothetical protein [Candidatus Electrothrix sp. ATG2]
MQNLCWQNNHDPLILSRVKGFNKKYLTLGTQGAVGVNLRVHPFIPGRHAGLPLVFEDTGVTGRCREAI